MTDSETLDDLAEAMAVTSEVTDRIAADRWIAATPCSEWDVRDVVNHLVGMNLVFVALFEESPTPESRAGRFVDPQPIRDDASAIDRLAAFTGRPVAWTR